MRTIVRTIQMTAVLLAGALLFGFFFRVGEDQAMAAPVGCLKWECVDPYAWWVGDAGTESLSAEKPGTVTPNAASHSDSAFPNFYAPASPGRLPLVQQSNTWDRFSWTDNDPDCKNGAPQSVQTKGTAKVDQRGYIQYKCTSP